MGDTVYGERAALVAFLTRVYPAHWTIDPAEPDWPVICIHGSAGQMAWHIAKADRRFFPADLETLANDWDGHSTWEKYKRLAELGRGANPLRLRAMLRQLRDAADRYVFSSEVSDKVRAGYRTALIDVADRALGLLFEDQSGTPSCETADAPNALPRRFQLHRDVDVSGVSGVGIVADGVRWPDGTADVRWRGDRPSAVHWDRMEHAEQVHGHGGATRVVWID